MASLNKKGYEFVLIHNCQYSNVYFNKELQLALCVAEKEYIPIDNFKDIFLSISQLVNEFPIKHLVFDKSKLRTFHQPSMEWYFAIWKPTVKENGLSSHFKILPELDWFTKSVEAGRHEILKKYSNNILDGITIEYVNSLESAIEKVAPKD